MLLKRMSDHHTIPERLVELLYSLLLELVLRLAPLQEPVELSQLGGSSSQILLGLLELCVQVAAVLLGRLGFLLGPL